MKPITFESTAVTLHRNLSWASYFAGYLRAADGRSHVSTYSFHPYAIEDFVRLLPFSTFYVCEQYEPSAVEFARRFPMFLVYVVKKLHSKCVFFEKSGRMLIGSQNLFAEKSAFEEVSTVLMLPEQHRQEALQLCFGYADRRCVNPIYCESDVSTYQGETGLWKTLNGKAYLPCHLEVEYWSNFGQADAPKDMTRHYIYLVLEYCCDGKPAYLAFDRLYQFCGELSVTAFKKLNGDFQVRKQEYAFLDTGIALQRSAPFKDQFALHHPVAKTNKAKWAHYLEYDA